MNKKMLKGFSWSKFFEQFRAERKKKEQNRETHLFEAWPFLEAKRITGIKIEGGKTEGDWKQKKELMGWKKFGMEIKEAGKWQNKRDRRSEKENKVEWNENGKNEDREKEQKEKEHKENEEKEKKHGEKEKEHREEEEKEEEHR